MTDRQFTVASGNLLPVPWQRTSYQVWTCMHSSHVLCKGPFTLDRLRARRASLGGSFLCILVHSKSTLHLSFQLESLDVGPALTMLRWCLDRSHVVTSMRQNPMLPPCSSLGVLRVQTLILWALNPMGFRKFFGLS